MKMENDFSIQTVLFFAEWLRMVLHKFLHKFSKKEK